MALPRFAAALVLVAAMTLAPAAAETVTLRCTVTAGGPGPALHTHLEISYGDCLLGTVEFDGFNVIVETHPDCHVDYDADDDGLIDGRVEGHVLFGWELWGSCPLGIVNQEVVLHYA